jgi:endonuclease/exonuclease/phosphatase family metal-dependent hydrolase
VVPHIVRPRIIRVKLFAASIRLDLALMTATTAKNTIINNQQLVEQLRVFPTFEELRRSQFYREYATTIRRLLDPPRVYECLEARPRLRSFLRVVEWNIERGARLDGIIEALNSHPVLRFADLLLLNELDNGMVRSGNLNIALELSRALEAHAVFGVEYLELTKGVGEETKLEGENTSALHGNAILTRHRFSNPQIIRLPRCENNFESKERRIGGRIGILLDLEIGDHALVIGNTHLDVVNTPHCRGRQMRALLQAVEKRLEATPGRPAIVGGDLNTHTFARGTRFHAIKNTATILNSNRANLRHRLSYPETKEPAIREFARFGYQTEGFNDRRATSRTIVSNLDDQTRLPGPMRWWVSRRIPPEGLLLEFRLDWLAARGLKPLGDGEVIDEQSGVLSAAPQSFHGLRQNGAALSDHDPIAFDVAKPHRAI